MVRSAAAANSGTAARLADVIDAAVVLLAADGDDILTTDVEDIADLARAADLHVEIVSV